MKPYGAALGVIQRMPLSQAIEPFCSEQVSGRLPIPFVHTQAAMHAQVGVPWHSSGIAAQRPPPPPATPPTSITHTLPLGQPPEAQAPPDAPLSVGIPLE